MPERNVIDIEGFSPDDLLAMPDCEIEALLLSGEPVVFRVGTAQILGSFDLDGGHLTVELSHIDGGGEGVLPALWGLVERFASSRKLASVEWIVHAVHCARPNLKLRRVLGRRGFELRVLDSGADVYYKFVAP